MMTGNKVQHFRFLYIQLVLLFNEIIFYNIRISLSLILRFERSDNEDRCMYKNLTMFTFAYSTFRNCSPPTLFDCFSNLSIQDTLVCIGRFSGDVLEFPCQKRVYYSLHRLTRPYGEAYLLI
jgi:hypothetical protein